MPNLQPRLSLALCAALGLSSAAGAQSIDTNALTLRGSRAEGAIALPSARLLEEGSWELSLTYEHDAEVVVANVPTGGVRGGLLTTPVRWIDNRDVAALQLAFSPFSRFELFGGLPALLGQSVHDITGVTNPSATSAIGDAHFGARFSLLAPRAWSERGLQWSVQGGLSAATGTQEAAFGEKVARFDAATTVTWQSGQAWAATAHAGYQMGGTFSSADQLFGDRIVAGAAGAYRVRDLQFSVEAVTTTVLASPAAGTNPARTSLEVLGGLRYFRELFFIDLGAGVAPLDAGLTPHWRVQATLGARGAFWAPTPPDPDPDHDGVLGAADRCPTVPEDLDGFQDGDGCPDPDNDGDGIPDVKDQCPLVPEDRDGIQDQDGCPETDADADGIPDEKDKCPLAAEDFDGFEDDDGCPEPGAPNGSTAFRHLALKEEAVFFETGKATLDPAAITALRPIARRLLIEPGNIVITGHADDQGTAERNDELSLQRAEVVKASLVAAGVPAERIQTRGAGQREPVSTTTGLGRSLNRAVTFDWNAAP